jgi:hypothetical protein
MLIYSTLKKLIFSDCGDPPYIENGAVTLNDPSNTSLAAEALLICSPGYNASFTTLYCGMDGNWDNATCSLAGNVFRFYKK